MGSLFAGSSFFFLSVVGETNARGNFAAAAATKRNNNDMRQKKTCNNTCRQFVCLFVYPVVH